MTKETNQTYFTKRAKQSRTAADMADDDASRVVHTTLAVAYDQSADDATDPLVSRDFPSKVEAVNGEVRVEGFKKQIVSFTPNAARLISDSLLRGANQAEIQNPDKCRAAQGRQVKQTNSKIADVTNAVKGGRIVKAAGARELYKAIFERDGSRNTEAPVATGQEEEEPIWEGVATPSERDRSQDTPASKG